MTTTVTFSKLTPKTQKQP